MAFAGAQVFYLDPAKVQSATTVSIDRIDVYFKSKPQATNNKSGITNPGVQLFLTTTANTVPQLPATSMSSLRWARLEYNDIQISPSANLASTFRFDPPVPFPTDSSIAFILQYDGDEDFKPWFDVTGDILVGTTNTVSTGTGKNSAIGPYYSYISSVPATTGTNSTNTNIVSIGSASANATLANSTYTAASWTAKTGTALKFNVYVARYTFNGDANLQSYTSNLAPSNAQIFTTASTTTLPTGEIQFSVPQSRMEYFFYDRVYSSVTNISAGERVFPILPEYPAGQATKATLSCTSGANTVVGNGVNFSDIIGISQGQPINLVIKSGNALGANADIVNVRQVTAILSNTQIALDQPLTFSNTAATFWIAPVATVDQFKKARFFGNTADVMVAKDSTANSTVLFNPMQINSISIAAGGSGYSNTDWVRITGHSYLANKYLQAWNANANIVTNGNGTITNVLLNNVGSGFWNIANLSYTVANTTGANSVGTGANLTFTVGTNIKGEFLGFSGKGGNFANIIPGSIDIGRVIPSVLVSSPGGTYNNIAMKFPYFSTDDNTVPMGRMLNCDPDASIDTISIQNYNVHYPTEFTKRRVLPSWSNELYVPFANGTSSNGQGGSSNTIVQQLSSNASILSFTVASNNDFTAVSVVPVGTKVTYSRYIINNDYTGENTSYGNAWAKGIETQFNLQANTLAEDLLVFATIYKPANTDVLVFAKLYNTQDNDSFDTKDWTMLECRSANAVVSSTTDRTNVFEATWGLQKYPNVAFTFAGTVTTTNGSRTITGSGTNFANLVSGDLVMIQNGLFQNSYMVAVVNTVANGTSLTISQPVANLNLVGSGFSLSKIAYKYQAFSNYLNDNVARYYSSTMAENDGFNSAQIKVVMLSANGLIVPFLNDIRAVAVSA